MKRILLAMVAVVGLGALVGAWAASRQPAKPAGKSGRAQENGAAGSVPSTAPAASSAAPAESEPATRIESAQIQNRWLQWLNAPPRDPFHVVQATPARVLAPESPISRFRLLATWLQSGSRLAAIDQKVYGEGDLLAEYRVVTIGADAVVVQGRESQERITFTSHVPSAQTGQRSRTNVVDQWLGPEKERHY